MQTLLIKDMKVLMYKRTAISVNLVQTIFYMCHVKINDTNWYKVFFHLSFSFKTYPFSIIVLWKGLNNFLTSYCYLFTVNLDTYLVCQFLANWRQWVLVKPIVYIRNWFLFSFKLCVYHHSQPFVLSDRTCMLL